jgi:hypothetical protein
MACSLEASPATKARKQALFIFWGLYCYPRSLLAGMGLAETLWYMMPMYKSIVHKTANSFVARRKITKDHRSYENTYLDNYGEDVTISSDIHLLKLPEHTDFLGQSPECHVCLLFGFAECPLYSLVIWRLNIAVWNKVPTIIIMLGTTLLSHVCTFGERNCPWT